MKIAVEKNPQERLKELLSSMVYLYLQKEKLRWLAPARPEYQTMELAR
jgi:hypothetical protein